MKKIALVAEAAGRRLGAEAGGNETTAYAEAVGGVFGNRHWPLRRLLEHIIAT